MVECIKVMAKETDKTAAKASSPGGAKKEFLVAATNMSWQLAVIVLLPIIGGYKLDQLLGSLPALTVLGFIIAMSGMAYVVWRQLQEFSS